MRVNTGVNKIFLLGRISSAIGPHAKKVAHDEHYFTLTTKEIHDRDGEQVVHIEHHEIVLHVDLLPPNIQLQKGQLAYLEGKIHTKGWTDERGIKRYKTQVIALQFKVFNIDQI